MFDSLPAKGLDTLTADEVTRLRGTEWITPLRGGTAGVSFPDEGGLVIHTACNDFVGTYTMSESVLTADLSKTEMACPAKETNNERALGWFFNSALTVLHSDDGGALWFSNEKPRPCR